ncbi:hypothetical protein FN846DRAFT_896648 [Sphaerosporella brunnea]|uniref:Uncharacterized protein n=1 Tax=Sphaerosporella brunnea TaxID=1250544 RepID=A0A5J5ECB1_9PEZI|nr:hypothetical protein FN846DRAFT_896648 [Sphaerosporella brunnea]
MGANKSKHIITITEELPAPPPPRDTVYYVERPPRRHSHRHSHRRSHHCHHHHHHSSSAPPPPSQQITYVAAPAVEAAAGPAPSPAAFYLDAIPPPPPRAAPVELVSIPEPSANDQQQLQLLPAPAANAAAAADSPVVVNFHNSAASQFRPFSIMVPAGTEISRNGVRLIAGAAEAKPGVLALRFSDGSTKVLRDHQGNYVRQGFEGYVSVASDGNHYWVWITKEMEVRTITRTGPVAGFVEA